MFTSHVEWHVELAVRDKATSSVVDTPTVVLTHLRVPYVTGGRYAVELAHLSLPSPTLAALVPTKMCRYACLMAA